MSLPLMVWIFMKLLSTPGNTPSTLIIPLSKQPKLTLVMTNLNVSFFQTLNLLPLKNGFLINSKTGASASPPSLSKSPSSAPVFPNFTLASPITTTLPATRSSSKPLPTASIFLPGPHLVSSITIKNLTSLIISTSLPKTMPKVLKKSPPKISKNLRPKAALS